MPTTQPRANQGRSSKAGKTGDDGILASFPRNGPDGEPATLRVSLSDFNDHLVLNVRQWVQTSDRHWVATKAGVTVRLGEIDAMITALGRAKLAMLDRAAVRSATDNPDPRSHKAGAKRITPNPRPSGDDQARRSVAPWES